MQTLNQWGTSTTHCDPHMSSVTDIQRSVGPVNVTGQRHEKTYTGTMFCWLIFTLFQTEIFFQPELDKARTIPDDIPVGDITQPTTHGFEGNHSNPCLKS